jgi:ABC-2 type transport system ATP-binding protein
MLAASTPTLSQPLALQIQNLSKTLSGRRVLSAIDLQLGAGDRLILLGPNGSGKSTLIRCLTGFLQPDEIRASTTQISIAGHDLQSQPLLAKKALGYAPEPTLLPAALTMRQVLLVAAAARGPSVDIRAGCETLETLGASAWLDRSIASLSLGTRQKLSIAIALLEPCPLIVLDEVFNGLDPLSCYKLKALLHTQNRQHGSALVLSTHDLHLALEIASDIELLQDGAIAASWRGPTLAALQAQGIQALESAVIAGMRQN